MTALAVMAHGGHGCISVSANVAPRICADMQEACLKRDFAAALKIQDRLTPLHQALFVDPNPAGAKYALSVLGKIANELRLPMLPASSAGQTAIKFAMIHAGLAPRTGRPMRIMRLAEKKGANFKVARIIAGRGSTTKSARHSKPGSY